jgi:hypothetical protein
MMGSRFSLSDAVQDVRRKLIPLLVFAAMIVPVVAASLATTGDAQADAPCSGGTHEHYHFPFHFDEWHDHGLSYMDEAWYRVYHIHDHGDYRHTRCT